MTGTATDEREAIRQTLVRVGHPPHDIDAQIDKVLAERAERKAAERRLVAEREAARRQAEAREAFLQGQLDAAVGRVVTALLADEEAGRYVGGRVFGPRDAMNLPDATAENYPTTILVSPDGWDGVPRGRVLVEVRDAEAARVEHLLVRPDSPDGSRGGGYGLALDAFDRSRPTKDGPVQAALARVLRDWVGVRFRSDETHYVGNRLTDRRTGQLAPIVVGFCRRTDVFHVPLTPPPEEPAAAEPEIRHSWR